MFDLIFNITISVFISLIFIEIIIKVYTKYKDHRDKLNFKKTSLKKNSKNIRKKSITWLI